MKNEITMNVNIGHTIKYLEIVSKHAAALAKELKAVPNTYCEKCGGLLFLKEVKEYEKTTCNIKQCCKCGKTYFTDVVPNHKEIEEPMTLEDLEKMKN
jgi:hypothetical protein